MEHLKLLFTKDGLQYQVLKQQKVTAEAGFLLNPEAPSTDIATSLDQILTAAPYSKISVLSALNHFTLVPEGFSDHESGYDLIAYNAPVDQETEELMLALNKKYGVQFYYTFPKTAYARIKSLKVPTTFNFSGEQFLSRLTGKAQKEIHINLYPQQCEFFALEDKKVLLYNNLDVTSEVDFLYFIMFTISKIGFGIADTHFFVYGETTENETFISELKKFVKHLKIGFDNIPKRHFLLNGK